MTRGDLGDQGHGAMEEQKGWLPGHLLADLLRSASVVQESDWLERCPDMPGRQVRSPVRARARSNQGMRRGGLQEAKNPASVSRQPEWRLVEVTRTTGLHFRFDVYYSVSYFKF